MSQKSITIHFPGEGAGETILVAEAGDGLYKLLEQPISKAAKYGDTIAVTNEAGGFRFESVSQPGGFELWQIIITAEAAQSDKMQGLLSELTDKGGYWQQDFGGMLTVLYDPKVYDPRADIESAAG